MTLPRHARDWFDAQAPVYDLTYDTPEVKHEDVLAEALLRRYIKPGTAVLDIGCGTGWLLDKLGDVLSRQTYLALDASRAMIEQHHLKHPGWPAAVADAENQWPDFPCDWRGNTPRVATCVWSAANHIDSWGLLYRFAASLGHVLLILGRCDNHPRPHLGPDWEVLPEPYHDLDPGEYDQLGMTLGLTLSDVRWLRDGSEDEHPSRDGADYVWFVLERSES